MWEARVARDVWHGLGLEEMSDCDEDLESIWDEALHSWGSGGSQSESPECDGVMPGYDSDDSDYLLAELAPKCVRVSTQTSL